MKKIVKIVGIGIVSIIVVLAGVAITYRTVKSQGVTESYEINQNIDTNKKILIATQKKDFKDEVIKKITNHYFDKDIYINIIDVTQLNNENIDNYDGTVVFSTVESNNPHIEVQKFLEQNKTLKNLFVYLTADSGSWDTNTYGVDALSSASKITDAEKVSKIIIEKINSFE